MSDRPEQIRQSARVASFKKEPGRNTRATDSRSMAQEKVVVQHWIGQNAGSAAGLGLAAGSQARAHARQRTTASTSAQPAPAAKGGGYATQ